MNVHKFPVLIGVHHDSLYNSTPFTNCCGVAICDDEARCPKCKELVVPGENASNDTRRRVRFNMAYDGWRR